MIEITKLSEQHTTIWETIHDIPVFKSANEFSLHIENLAMSKGMTHLDAVIEFCKDHSLEPTDVASKINKGLKEKIGQNYRDLNYLPKQAQLDL